ncbi:hypothetical protein ACFC1T_34060 [Kitasatospora sp. NPDC056076]|uniref:hypothetical protein n=1 Tax=Kitasatospora sp. NPDC056076 TaxID=3345703 RepID=UPI0035D6E498
MSTIEQASGARRWLNRRRTDKDTAAEPAGPAALHEVGAHFVIASGTDAAALPAALTDALAALEAVPGTVTVLAAAPDPQPVLLGRLDDLARTAADRNAATLVLAASALAAPPASGRRPAQRLAELAATSIVAPDGLVTLRPDGTLLTSGATDAEPSSWWLFTPDGRTRRLGPVWPLPRAGTGTAPGRAGTGAAPGGAGTGSTGNGTTAAVAVTAAAVAATPTPPATTTAGASGEHLGAPHPLEADPTHRPATPALPAAGPLPSPAAPVPRQAAQQAAVPDPTPLPTNPVGTSAPAPRAGEPTVAGPAESTVEALTAVLPHGFWFPGTTVPAAVPDPLLRAATAPGTPVLVVGRPHAPLPPAADVAAIAAAAAVAAARPGPPGTRPAELLISAPWADPAQLVALTGALAAALGHDVRAAVGLPTRTASGWSARVLGADGAPGWEPWLTELTACRELGRVIASAWRPLPAAFADCGPALHQAPVAGWRLEAVPAGLWLRPDQVPDDRGPRLLVPDPTRPTLIAGSADLPAPAEVLAVLEDLVSALTEPGAPAPRLLLPATPTVRRTHPATPATPTPPEPIAPATAATVTTQSTTPDTPAPTPEPHTPPEPITPATAATVTTQSTTPDIPAPTPEPAGPQDPPTPQAEGAGPGEPPAPPQGAIVPDSPDTPGRAAAPRLLVPPTVGTTAAGRASTPAERAAFRALLGADFHRYAGRAEQAALRMPALRAQARDDLKDDLAAVYLHHADTGIPVHRAELVEAARRGDHATGPLAPYLACLGSGLRRLPNHRGAVLLGAEAGEEVLAQYVRGALLVEPAPVVGTAEAEVVPGTGVEFLVWSATGRRTSVIAEEGDPEVVFPPGTRFLVLDVLPAGEDRPARVLLRETGQAPAPEGEGAGDEQDRSRLLAWQARRDQLPPERLRAPARPERLRLTPGVRPDDPRGVPS